MPFVEAARAQVAELPKGDRTRIVLEFLLARAVGQQRAIPWPKIRDFLLRRGHRLSKNSFQQGILKQTRESAVFIGSGKRGYYLIADADDAREMRDFYLERIASERQRLTRLRRLARECGWTI